MSTQLQGTPSSSPPPEEGNPLTVLMWMAAAFIAVLVYGYLSGR